MTDDRTLQLNKEERAMLTTPSIAEYYAREELDFLRDELGFLKKLLFRNAKKLQKIDMNSVLEARGYPFYFTTEQLLEGSDNVSCLYDSYRALLKQFEDLGSSEKSDDEMVRAYQDLETKADGAKTDLRELIDLICAAVGDDRLALDRTWRRRR